MMKQCCLGATMNIAEMTYEEFEQAVANLFESNIADISYVLKNTWTTGGQTGGSCWDEGESHYYAISADPVPDLTDLDTILDSVSPAISFRQYRQIMIPENEVLEFDTHDGDGDYYGNYTNQTSRTINLAKLYAALRKIAS